MFFRYQRGSRSLAANLSMAQTTSVAAAVTSEMETQEEEYDIPTELETVIGEPRGGLFWRKLFVSLSLKSKSAF